jgi:hypothetical protein
MHPWDLQQKDHLLSIRYFFPTRIEEYADKKIYGSTRIRKEVQGRTRKIGKGSQRDLTIEK